MSSHGGLEYLSIETVGGPSVPPFHVPDKDVAGWFERNGTLISCDEILERGTQEANDNHGLACGIQFALGNSQDGASNQNNVLQTSTYDIAISPHATLHIVSLANHHFRPAYMLVTESHWPRHHHGSQRHQFKKKISYLIVSNCSGYWVSDYCGLGGFQQALFFPNHQRENEDDGPINSLELPSHDLLLNGAILTDGVDLWLPSTLSSRDTNDRTNPNNTVKIIKSTVSSWMYEGSCPELILPTICNSSNSKRKGDTSLASLDDSGRQVRQRTVGEQEEECITGNNMDSTIPAPDWRMTIERALGERLKSLKQEQMEQAREKQIRDFVLLKSQKALQELIDNDNWTNDDNDVPKPKVPPVKLTELRYLLHHQTEVKHTGSSSGAVILALEADILCLNEQSTTDTDKQVALRNAHLSCSPVNIQNDDNRRIVCQSGVIPSLHFGEYVTVSVQLKFDDKALSPQHSPSGKDLLDLSVCILGNHPENEMPIHGLYLGSVSIPLSKIMQTPTNQEWCRCVSPSERQEDRRPSIAYDCQPPDPT